MPQGRSWGQLVITAPAASAWARSASTSARLPTSWPRLNSPGLGGPSSMPASLPSSELAHGRELSLDGAHLLVDGNGRGAVSEEQGEQVLTPVRVRHHARERAAARIGSVQQVHGPLLTGDADLDRELALTVVD